MSSNDKFVCEIDLKPSPELIPDEYTRENNEKFNVHVFVFKKNIEENFVDCMKSLGYIVHEDNVHLLSTRDRVESTLEEICEKIENSTNGLIILFWGHFKADKKFLLKDGTSIKLTEIWGKFLTSNCPQLREKPKIFIFNSFHKNFRDDVLYTEVDTFSFRKKKSTKFPIYKTPTEADILIIFAHNENIGKSIEYINSLCSNFRNYSQREEISSLLTIAHFSTQPILISTMTRKFYLEPSINHGILLSIKEKYVKIEQAVEKVKENIIQLTNKEREELMKEEKSNGEEVMLRKLSRQEHAQKLEKTRHFSGSMTTFGLKESERFLSGKKLEKRPAWR